MPKYEVNLTFNLATQVEPEVRFDEPSDSDVIAWSDDCSFGGESVTSYGGEINLTVEAEDEDSAGEKAREIFEAEFGTEVEDYNFSLTWEIEDLDVQSVEALEEPMTADRAFEIVEAWLASGPDCPTPEIVGALVFLLALVKTKLVEA